MHHLHNIQLAINFTKKEFYDMLDELPDYHERKSHFDRLVRESPAYRLFPREIHDLILKERYSDKRMKILLAPYKIDNVLPGIWLWENKKMIKLDVSDIWNNLEVCVHTHTTTTYSIN